MKRNFFYTFFLFICTLSISACSDSPNKPEESTINWTEIPQACSAQFNGDTVFFDIAFKNWSMREIDILKEYTSISTMIYNGLDESTIKEMCDEEKNKSNSTTEILKTTNVICTGDTIYLESISKEKLVGINSASAVANRLTNTCNQLFNGNITLKDIFLSESEQ